MNTQQQLLRDAIHRVDDSAREHELEMTGEKIVSMAAWILNSSYGKSDRSTDEGLAAWRVFEAWSTR